MEEQNKALKAQNAPIVSENESLRSKTKKQDVAIALLMQKVSALEAKVK